MPPLRPSRAAAGCAALCLAVLIVPSPSAAQRARATAATLTAAGEAPRRSAASATTSAAADPVLRTLLAGTTVPAGIVRAMTVVRREYARHAAALRDSALRGASYDLDDLEARLAALGREEEAALRATLPAAARERFDANLAAQRASGGARPPRR